MKLYLDFTEPALIELSAAGESVRSYQGDEAAERFSRIVSEEIADLLERLAEEIAESVTGKPFDPLNAAASVYWSQPVYRLVIETSARRARRSGAGRWHAYYALQDVAGQGKPDTVKMLAIRHSASLPIGQNDDGAG